MHRISPNNPVRRRLFSEDHEEARIDNFANLLQESMVTEREHKKAKYNFDFENDTPLEGDYEWYRCDGQYEWIGVKDEAKIEETKPEESFLPMQHENEVTPKSKEEESAPSIRKRRKDVESCSDKARRRISFD